MSKRISRNTLTRFKLFEIRNELKMPTRQKISFGTKSIALRNQKSLKTDSTPGLAPGSGSHIKTLHQNIRESQQRTTKHASLMY